MAGPKYLLEQTWKETDAAGVGQYEAVILDGSDATGSSCKKSGTAGEACLGITQEEQANQNQNVNVRTHGVSRALAAGAIAAGDHVESAGDGTLQKVTVDYTKTVTHNQVGIALSPATNANDIFFVLLTPGVTVPGA